jgi:tetratricopeptide (TPR) repeat protein
MAALLGAPRTTVAAEIGERVVDVSLPALAGGQVHLLPPGGASYVLVFVKPNHPRCLEALQEMAAYEAKQAGARWVAILPGDTPPADAVALARESGVKMPFVFDPGDRLYGQLSIKLHPSIVVVDRTGRVAGLEPYRRIQYGDRVIAQIRFSMGEITAAQLAQEEDPGRSETRSDEAGVARHHVKYAGTLFGLGQLDQALDEVTKGLSTTPSAGAYGLQARILKRLGRCEDARHALEAATKLGAGDVVAEQEPCPPAKGSRVQ